MFDFTSKVFPENSEEQRMRNYILPILLFIFLGCQNSRINRHIASGDLPLSRLNCAELFKGVIGLNKMSSLKRIDPYAIEEVEVVTFGNFISYSRELVPGNQTVVVRRSTDGKIIHEKKVRSDDLDSLIFDRKKGRLFEKRANGRLIRVKGFQMKGLERKPVSYDEVLSVMKEGEYDVDKLPTIPLQMFRYFRKGIVEFFVGRRSTEILTKGLDYREKGMAKPIHPMGIGVEGKIKFQETRFSGIFSGGEFPVLGRLSISQGNASKFKERTWLQRLLGRPASGQERSVAAAFKVFPTGEKGEKVVTANALFQNDLNGEILEDYISGVMTNQPQLNFLKIRKLYEVFTLIGVAKGALSNPNDIKATFPFINPQLRPLHQFAEAGVENPADVVVPKWIKIQAVEEQPIVDADDFRVELYETIQQKGLKYKIFLADSIDENKEIIWEEAGEINFNNSILSRGVDENLLFHHDGLRSPFTGELLDAEVVPKPKREVMDYSDSGGEEVEVLWWPKAVTRVFGHTDIVVGKEIFSPFMGLTRVGDLDKKYSRAISNRGKAFFRFKLNLTPDEHARIREFVDNPQNFKDRKIQSCVGGACRILRENTDLNIPFPFSQVPSLNAIYLMILKKLGHKKIVSVEYVHSGLWRTFTSYEPVVEILGVGAATAGTAGLIVWSLNEDDEFEETIIPLTGDSDPQ